jgi:peptidyl-prolyl cis-trans isomerase SurA
MRISSSRGSRKEGASLCRRSGLFRYDHETRLRWSRGAIGRIGRHHQVVFLLVVLGAVLMAVPSRVCAEITNRVVATVNSDIITLYELNGSIEQVTGLSVSSFRQQDEGRFYQIRKAVLNNLINQKITEQQIRKLGITVTERDIDEAIERVKRERGTTQEELLYTLKVEGITLKEYRQRVKEQIEHARLVDYEVKSKIVITEADSRNYYQNHIEEFSNTHKVKLARILIKTPNPVDKEGITRARNLGEEILRKLETGSAFSDMARAYSQGPAGPEGGCLGWIAFDQLDSSLKKMVAKLTPGDYTEPHECRDGIQIVQLVDEIEGGTKPFEEVSDIIYSELFRGKVEEKYADWLSKLREESFIKVVF